MPFKIEMNKVKNEISIIKEANEDKINFKNTVFNLKENSISTAIKYYCLCIIQMLISGVGVTYLFKVSEMNEVGLKLIVDVLLFLLSFQIQREWVFKREVENEGGNKRICI